MKIHCRRLELEESGRIRKISASQYIGVSTGKWMESGGFACGAFHEDGALVGSTSRYLLLDQLFISLPHRGKESERSSLIKIRRPLVPGAQKNYTSAQDPARKPSSSNSLKAPWRLRKSIRCFMKMISGISNWSFLFKSEPRPHSFQ